MDSYHVKKQDEKAGLRIRNNLPPEEIYCTKQACAIQYCLQRYNHQEKYCQQYILDWKKCRDQARRTLAKEEAEGKAKQAQKTQER